MRLVSFVVRAVGWRSSVGGGVRITACPLGFPGREHVYAVNRSRLV